MGVWGAGLYSDDLACDMKDDYKDLLGDGYDEPQAMQKIQESYQTEMQDYDNKTVFWLVLADLQWRHGRLQEEVKQKAIQIIDEGEDLLKWEHDRSLLYRRKQTLNKLKEKLISPQPAKKKVKKRKLVTTTWEVGDIYSYQLPSTEYILLHVNELHTDRGGTYAEFGILNWTGKKIPSQRKIKRLKYKDSKKETDNYSKNYYLRKYNKVINYINSFSCLFLPKNYSTQFKLIHKNIHYKYPICGTLYVFNSNFEEFLEKHFFNQKN